MGNGYYYLSFDYENLEVYKKIIAMNYHVVFSSVLNCDFEKDTHERTITVPSFGKDIESCLLEALEEIKD